MLIRNVGSYEWKLRHYWSVSLVTSCHSCNENIGQLLFLVSTIITKFAMWAHQIHLEHIVVSSWTHQGSIRYGFGFLRRVRHVRNKWVGYEHNSHSWWYDLFPSNSIKSMNMGLFYIYNLSARFWWNGSRIIRKVHTWGNTTKPIQTKRKKIFLQLQSNWEL